MRVDLRLQVGVFFALFAGGMWLSKVAQPLYFEQRGALVAFGIGYAVMAVVGGLSFVWGALADRFGGLRAVRIGAVLYAVGIAGRAFTDVVPVVLFSALAGAGASLVLVAVRPWIRSSASDDEIPRIVGARTLGNQIGVVIGSVGAAGLFALVADPVAGPLAALLGAPLLVVAAFVWTAVVARSDSPTRSDPVDPSPTPRGRFTALAAKLVAIGLLSGFYVSLVTPYLPLILTEGGASPSIAALAMAAMSFVQIGVSAVLARRGMKQRPFALFFVAEAITGALTLAAILVLGSGVWWITVVFVLRASFVALAVAAEETIQYAVIPAHAAGFVFGVSQTAFLIGDALGGALGAPIWLAAGAEGMLLTAGVITLANAVLLPLLLRGLRASRPVAEPVP